MNARQVFNGTYTIAGWHRRWYVIEGTPPINWATPMIAIVAMSIPAVSFGFADRSSAMSWLRHRIERNGRQAAREATSPVPPAGL